MHACKDSALRLDDEVVWIDGGASAPLPSAKPCSTIGELAERFGVTPRALRFYESKGLLSPQREMEMRSYTQSDIERLALILKAKKFGFTLGEIRQMVEAGQGGKGSRALKLSRDKCLEQINLLEQQVQEREEALAELRRIHTMLSSPTAASR